MPTEFLNGINIYYQRTGTGPRLLYVNGSGATLALVGPMLGVFTNDFDVLAHDQRGLGLTSIPVGPYEMADYAADAAALAASIGWDTYNVFGVSFGGMVAQELAVTFPSRIERLVLACTSSGGAGGSSYPLHQLVDTPDEQRHTTQRSIMDNRFTDEWLAEHESDRFLAEALGAQRAVEKTAEVERGERLQLDARSRHDVFDRLTRIACPTLVASGRFDGIAPPANGEAIATQIPNADFQLYDGGHAFFFQDASAFPNIKAFLLS